MPYYRFNADLKVSGVIFCPNADDVIDDIERRTKIDGLTGEEKLRELEVWDIEIYEV